MNIPVITLNPSVKDKDLQKWKEILEDTYFKLTLYPMQIHKRHHRTGQTNQELT